MYNFYVTQNAQNEFMYLLEWYSEVNESLAYKFMNEYEVALNKVVKSPTHFSYISKTLRRCKFSIIQAMVTYKFENNFIEILSIKDTRSKPNKNFY